MALIAELGVAASENNVDLASFRRELTLLDTEDLLARRAEGDRYLPEAQAAIAAELTSRGLTPPPLPQAPIEAKALSPEKRVRTLTAASIAVLVASLVLANGLVGVLATNPVWHAAASAICILLLFIQWSRSSAENKEVTPEEAEQKRLKAREAAKKRVGHGGYSELMFAAADGDLARVKQLLQYGAEVNGQDSKGGTPLMYAAMNGHREVVEFLLELGADRKLRSSAGLSAADYARKGGFTQLHALLE